MDTVAKVGWLAWMCGLAAVLASIALPSAVSAQTEERPTATILTSQLTGVEPGEGAAFDRTLRARLDALHVVRTEGAVALDLEQIQLALGCMGETTECLSAVASETGTNLIVVPSLAEAGSTTVATVLVFDARDQSMRRGTRETASGDSAALLGGVEGLLREVFGLPAEVETVDTTPVEPPPARPGLSPVPIVVIVVGAVALIAGAIAGGLSLEDASTYQGLTFHTDADVDAGASLLSRQQTEALVADGLLIGGGVVALAGLIWQMAAGNEDGSSPLALSPVVSSTQVGLVLNGSFGGAL
jgi:hypothetical protein